MNNIRDNTNYVVIHHCPDQPSVYRFRELDDIVLFPGYGYAARLSVSAVMSRRDAPTPVEMDNIPYYAGKDLNDYTPSYTSGDPTPRSCITGSCTPTTAPWPASRPYGGTSRTWRRWRNYDEETEKTRNSYTITVFGRTVTEEFRDIADASPVDYDGEGLFQFHLKGKKGLFKDDIRSGAYITVGHPSDSLTYRGVTYAGKDIRRLYFLVRNRNLEKEIDSALGGT